MTFKCTSFGVSFDLNYEKIPLIGVSPSEAGRSVWIPGMERSRKAAGANPFLETT